MKLLRYPILIGIFCLFSSVTSLSTEKADAFWSKTSIPAMNQIVVLYPAAPNLDALLTSLTGGDAASFAKINVAALPSAPASTGVVASDIQLVLNDMATGFADLGGATSIIFQQIGFNSLPGNPPSNNVILTDLSQLKSRVKGGFLSLGQAVTDVSALVKLPDEPTLFAGITNVLNLIQLPNPPTLFAGITSVNNVLGAGGAAWFAPPAPDAHTKATNLLARLNAIASTNFTTIEAYVRNQEGH